MNDLETIENYLSGQLSPEDRARFETALRTDPAVADALAFYVLTRDVAKTEAQQQRRAEFEQLRQAQGRRSVAQSWSAPIGWVAAASVLLLLGLSWYFLRGSGSMTGPEVADAYIASHFDQLSTTMGSSATDSLTQGVALFNDGKLAEAETVFQQVLTRQPDNDRALRYAGITSLRQGNYDQAIDRFHRLSQRPELVSNPGAFYEALAHLKRNRPMDKAQAKKLLATVIDRNLEGKSEAQKIFEITN